MRNKQLQDKLEEMLVELRKQPDEMGVSHLTNEGLKHIHGFGMYLVDDQGIEVDATSKPDRIVLYV